MTEKSPPSRPALRKSVDAALHPALAGRPVQQPPATSSTTGTTSIGAKPVGAKRAAPTARKPLTKAKRAPTSDVLRPTKQDPAVKLTITIPKSLRKQLKVLAKEQGVSPQELAARVIADALA